MASVATVKRDDMVEINYRGAVCYGVVTGAPEKVSPQVYELPVRIVGGAWQVGRARNVRVRGRQVTAVFRRLKS